MKDNFWNEFQSLLGNSQDIIDKYDIYLSANKSVPISHRSGYVIVTKEDMENIGAMIKLLDDLEKENTELKAQLQELKKTGCNNLYDYYFPCGGGSLINDKSRTS